MTRLKAAIIGATGMAGQQFVSALSHHPEFEVVEMVTSRNKKTYRDALLESDGSSRWTQTEEIPSDMTDIPVISSNYFKPEKLDIIFSAIDSSLASILEPTYAKVTPTISTSSAFRYELDTPIVIPGVNEQNISLISEQRKKRNWNGFLIPTSNCTVMGLAICLDPLISKYGVNKVLMVSMQSVSGAGRSPGVRTLDSLDNIIPYIPQEEEKVRMELQKIFGKVNNSRIVPEDIPINCICTRANVSDGHTEAVFCGLDHKAPIDEIKKMFNEHNPFKTRNLHSAPKEWFKVFNDPFRPQVRVDRNLGDGMTTSIGRIEVDEVLGGIKFVLVSHNTKMGAGKGAVLLAECLLEQEYVRGCNK